MLTLQITLGVLLGEVLFTALTTAFLSFRRRNQKSELESLLANLEGLDFNQPANDDDTQHSAYENVSRDINAYADSVA